MLEEAQKRYSVGSTLRMGITTTKRKDQRRLLEDTVLLASISPGMRPSRRPHPPRQRHQRCEAEVEQGEHPGRKVVEDQSIDPVADEVRGVRRRPGVQPQRVLERGKRADRSDRRLDGYEQDGREMGRAQGEAPRPSRARYRAGD